MTKATTFRIGRYEFLLAFSRDLEGAGFHRTRWGFSTFLGCFALSVRNTENAEYKRWDAQLQDFLAHYRANKAST